MGYLIDILGFILLMIAAISAIGFCVCAYMGYVMIEAIRRDHKKSKSQ